MSSSSNAAVVSPSTAAFAEEKETDTPQPIAFPVESLIPTVETGAASFAAGLNNTLNNKPNVRIGILDTGIDPALPAVRYMPDGVTPKLVHVCDCTGSGDVDVSHETWAKYDANKQAYTVTGLTGRTIVLKEEWSFAPFPPKETSTDSGDAASKTEAAAANKPEAASKAEAAATASKPESSTAETGATAASETDTATAATADAKETDAPKEKDATKETDTKTVPIRLGLKRGYELYSSKLVTRVQTERSKLLAAALEPSKAEARQRVAAAAAVSKPSKDDLKKRDDWQARLQVLDDGLSDPGPVYDVVVWYDGTHFRTILLQGDAESDAQQVPLTDYHVERQYATFGTVDCLNYAVNFYQSGTVVSLVRDCSPHGTHVACIAAAASQDDPNLSGVAPWAELVSLGIGDVRLGGMETGTSLVRAMYEAVRWKCDVVNLSYGEGTALCNAGRVVQLAVQTLMQRHGICFVSSAGNNGPALSTVGAPGGTTHGMLGVAAYVSPQMMVADYSMLVNQNSTGSTATQEEQFTGSTFTWSSVGPTPDGDWGVDCMAPGGAICPVSQWTLQRSMLMNGTSMSSPHAAGCVALLVSACKQAGISTNPARLVRAIVNTAQPVSHLERLQQGAGMIQVPQAFEYLKQHGDLDTEDVWFLVEIDNRPGTPRGIYLRQPHEASSVQTCVVHVTPEFKQSSFAVTPELQQTRLDFEMHLRLETDAPDWVTVPDFFLLVHNGRSFKIKVDPTDLPPGVHTASVMGFDTVHPDRKALFTVPIVVCKALPVATSLQLSPPHQPFQLEVAQVKRHFVVPPPGATWMDVTVTDARSNSDTTNDSATTDTSTKLVVLHTIQLLPHAAYRDYEKQRYLNLMPGQTVVTSIPVEHGVTLEVTLARYWSTLGATAVHVSCEFRGVRPVPDQVVLPSGSKFCQVRIHSDVRDEVVLPTAKLTKWWTPVRPKADAVLEPLPAERDASPSSNKRTYQLILQYEFEQEEEKGGSFTPRVVPLQGVLYESSYESQLMLIMNGEKKVLGAADAWPSAIQAPKGPVVMRLQIRHDDPTKLEKLRDTMVWIERNLEKELALSAYATREGLMHANGSFKKKTLRRGTSASVFFSEPPAAKLPSGCKPGDLLLGTATFCSGEVALAGDGKRPGGFPVTYTVGPKPKKAAEPEAAAEPKDEPSTEEKMVEAVRNVQVEHLSKLTKKEKEAGKFQELFGKLEKDYPDYLPLHMAKLKYVDTHPKRSEMLHQVIAAAEQVTNRIAQDELAMHFGRKSDADDPEAVKEREKMKEKKTFLIEALVRTAMAYADSKEEDASQKFDEMLQKLKPWVEIDSGDKYAALVIERETRAGRYGCAIKIVNKLLAKELKDDVIKPLTKSDLYQKRAALLEKMGYMPLVEYDKLIRVLASPKNYALF